MSWESRKHVTLKTRCRKKDMSYNLNVEYLKTLKVNICPVSGVKLCYKVGDKDNTATVDRIDPDLGYVKGNVEVVSQLINNIKGKVPPDKISQIHCQMFNYYYLKRGK